MTMGHARLALKSIAKPSFGFSDICARASKVGSIWIEALRETGLEGNCLQEIRN
jgi:hypothetical protein